MNNSCLFITKANLYSGDCRAELHGRDNEPASCLHYHDFYELFVYLGKNGKFVIDGKEYAVVRGDIVLAGMFTPHMLIPEKGETEDCFVAHINPELLFLYSKPGCNLLDIFERGEAFLPVHSSGAQGFRKYQYLLDEYRHIDMQPGQELLINAIIHKLLAYAYCDFFAGEHCAMAASRDMNVVTQIIKYINVHLTEKFSLPVLAKEINYSECYICHLFKAATKKTISGYIREKRIEMASRLVAQSVPINKVAEQSGFYNYSNFYKTFKSVMGISPEEYRRSIAEQNSPALASAQSSGRPH